MLISVLDNDKITKYNLPEVVDGTYLMKYRPADSKVERDILIEAIDGKWYLKSNGSVDAVIDNAIVDRAVLTADSKYMLSVSGQKIYSILYCSVFNYNAKRYSFDENQVITIGKASNATISFDDVLMAPIHATIYREKDKWKIKSSELDWARIYINNIRKTSAELYVGDVIFINGLKIVWMEKFMVVNNPYNKAIFANTLMPYNTQNLTDNNSFTENDEDDELSELYDEKDYFTRIPRLKTTSVEEKIVIDEPPASRLDEELPIVFTLGTSLMMIASCIAMGYNAFQNLGNGKKMSDIWTQFLMVGAMVIGALIVPQLMRKYQAKKKMQKEMLRQKKYTDYLNSKEDAINKIMKSQSQVLNDNYPPAVECINIVNNKTRRLWEKEIKDDDFLSIKLGQGNAPSNIDIIAPAERFTLEEDKLRDRVFDIVEHSKMLENVPISFSFAEKNISAIICENTYNQDYINNLILQIVTYHSPIDLKIVLLTNKDNLDRWNYFKILPHCWTDNREMRFYAEDIEEMKSISSYLENELNTRKELINNNDNKEIKKQDGYKNFAPYYLVITDDYRNAKNIQFLKSFLREEENYGFSLLLIDDSMRNIPTECETFIDVLEKSCCIFQKELNSRKQINFIPEYNSDIDMQEISFELANIPVASNEMMNLLPNSISFLEMYNVGNISQLNVINRWKTSNPVITLEAPIGVHPSGEVFKLNLHEKFQGPHGLIAGSTGSGKSEFIITYILSMAVNYHPDDVQFVLIDYKGGGLAGAFENRETGLKIPHLAGTITNLDTNEMNRTLVSIQSELKRRQAKFNEARDKLDESTIDIYKYQKYYHEGLLDEPISHLFIISDEFAELKSQQPEFMQQLISIARIGRSLGVHLILSTQKPSGVVNDQIWSNTRFRLCLKVQSRNDSLEMLKRPEAASIKETGRFYLQVGYDELFEIGQSAWCGAKYVPMERIKKKQDDAINFVNNTGYIIKTISDIRKKDDAESHGEQLTNIVKYLSELAQKENYKSHQLWLDKIPEVIYVDDIKKKYNYKAKQFVIDTVIGEYDDPTNQKQDLAKINLTENGNAIVFGLPTTGKENLLSTFIYSTIMDHTVDEVNFYILDFGAEILRIFNKTPHVGDIAYIEDEEKVSKLFKLINNEMEHRKDLFVEYAGSYSNYIKNSGQTLPSIIIIINAYENFQEKYANYEEEFNSLSREANKYGIYFVISTSVNSCIRSRILQNFNNRLSMQLSDTFDYRSLLNSPRDLTPSKNFGRGIIRIDDVGFEFQTAFIVERSKINEYVKDLAIKLSNQSPKIAPRVPILPKKINYNDLENKNSLKMVPIGMYKDNVQTVYYDFTTNKFNLVVASMINDKIPFIKALIKQLSIVSNVKVKVIDVLQILDISVNNVELFNNNFDKVVDLLYKDLAEEEKNTFETVYIVVGFGQLKNKLSKEIQSKYNAIFNSLTNFIHSYFIVIDTAQSLRSLDLETWYRNNVSSVDGVWLGEDIYTQNVLKVTNFNMNDRKVVYPDLGLIVQHGNYYFMKYMISSEGDVNAR